MRRPLILTLIALMGCDGATSNPVDPSDDPADYEVDTTIDYEIEVTEPRWIVPSEAVPSELRVQESNNNVDIELFEGRLFMAWRTGPTHFASDKVEMLVMSSPDLGETWEYETHISVEKDLREPRLLRYRGTLQLMYFEAGTFFAAFEPVRIWRITRKGKGKWSNPQIVIDDAEVPWDIKVRGDVAYMSSYTGEHYEGSDPELYVHFKSSSDGDTWKPVENRETVYTGGVSEVAFEFDENNDLWIVTRNEDGDDSGYGSHVCTAKATSLSQWECPARCDPERYDSPEMFRHGKDIYLIARRDIGGPYGNDDGDMVPYSLRPKRTALYQIDRETQSVVHLFDLPGVGDTAFPAVRRLDAHRFIFANYTSPLDEPDITWVRGQTSPQGTQLYLAEITFIPLINTP